MIRAIAVKDDHRGNIASLGHRWAFFDEFEPTNAALALTEAFVTCRTAGEAPGDHKYGESGSKEG
jgi:hypothetical protein